MPRRQLRYLSGAITGSLLRQRQLSKRDFRYIPGGLVQQPDEGGPINFRVYDFSTGQILWEDFFTDPLVATDGTVWARFSEEVTYAKSNSYIPQSSGSLFPFDISLDETDTLLRTYWQQFDKMTGSLLQTGFTIDWPIAFNEGTGGQLYPSRREVDASGNWIHGWNLGGHIVRIDDPNDATLNEYWITPTGQTEGVCNLTIATVSTALDTWSTAQWSYNDNAAAIETEITSAFGTNVVSVTVTGGPVNTTCLKIEIEWNHPDYYLREFDPTTPSGLASLVGGSVIQNLASGSIQSHSGGPQSSSWQNGGYWDNNGDVVMQKPQVSPANNTILRLVNYDVSTFEWTENWDAERDGTLLITAESNKLGPFTDGTVTGMTYPAREVTGPAVEAVSVFALDGTGRTDLARLEYNEAALVVAVQDDGTDLCGLATDWVFQNGTSGSTDNIYGSRSADDWERFNTSGVVQDVLMTGRFYPIRNSGFNDAALASIRVVPPASIADNTIIGEFNATGATGQRWDAQTQLVQPGGLTPDYYQVDYYIFAPLDFQCSACEWRIEFEGGLVTSWLDETATATEVQTALDNLLGTDIDGNKNAEFIQTGTPSAPVSPMIWQQNASIRCISAQNSTDATAQDWVTEFIGQTTESTIITCSIRIRSVTLQQGKTIGSVAWSTGAVNWERSWQAPSLENTVFGCLFRDLLYVKGDTHNGSLFFDEQAASGDVVAIDSSDTTQSGEVWAGGSTSQHTSGVQLLNVTVPNGANIERASLILDAYEVNSGNNSQTVKGIPSAGTWPPTTKTAIDALTPTTAGTTAVLDDEGSTGLVTIDVTEIVQELVSAGSWSAGDSMTFRISYASSAITGVKLKADAVRLLILY